MRKKVLIFRIIGIGGVAFLLPLAIFLLLRTWRNTYEEDIIRQIQGQCAHCFPIAELELPLNVPAHLLANPKTRHSLERIFSSTIAEKLLSATHYFSFYHDDITSSQFALLLKLRKLKSVTFDTCVIDSSDLQYFIRNASNLRSIVLINTAVSKEDVLDFSRRFPDIEISQIER